MIGIRQEYLADRLDARFYYSLYWRRDQYGALTLDGWRDARATAVERLREAENKAREIRSLLPRIDAEIAKREKWATEDAEPE